MAASKRSKTKSALLTALNGNPEIRAALVRRITLAAEKVPVALLHQVAQALELAGSDEGAG